MTAVPINFDIRLLDTPHVTLTGREVALGPARRQAVFAALVLNSGRAVPRAELIAAVWGEDPPSSAMGNLYTYVSALRSVLEPGRDRWSSNTVLTSRGGAYRLHVQPEEVDVHRFERARERSRSFRASGDARGELAALEAALAEWQGGEPLAGVPGPHAEDQRVRLGELYLASAERHAELMLGFGRAAEVVDRLLPLAARHPTRESLHAVTMLALAAGDRVDEAIALYTDLRDRLATESGTEPGAAVIRIHAQLAGDAARPSRPRSPVPPRHPGFRGRIATVSRLRQAVAALADGGRGGSLWISGEAGIGKSALLAEGLRDVVTTEVQVGWGVGDEPDQGAPLSLLPEFLPRETANDLLAPLYAAHGMMPPTMAVIDAVKAFVVVRCAESPVLLVLDDMQWADDTSLLVWHALHELTDRLPLLLVSASRPLPTGHEMRLLRRLLPRNGTTLIDLGPLDDPTATELVRCWTLRADIEPGAVRSMVAAAGGNPFYLRHLVITERQRLSANTPTPELIEAVHRHLRPLTDDTRQLLHAVAFLGNNHRIADLAAVTGKPLPALVPFVEQAMIAGVLVEDGDRVRFRHPVVRQVLRGAIPTALRVTMHRQFAQRIAEAGGDLHRVAGQLLAGPVPIDAWVEQWLTANVEQLSVTVPASAIAVLRHAVSSPSLSPPSRELLAARLRRSLLRAGLLDVAGPGRPAAPDEYSIVR
ncbi:BTAD domain-containing putative transcriptional regulator [Actinoplanes sp. CA-252034]|uniref:BTAD domain-containing putative transcriptional regulator n=1 Tax=Actinoplanes sp. CA-252034 TaxID=3239906 RepID=UPI003D95B2DE